MSRHSQSPTGVAEQAAGDADSDAAEDDADARDGWSRQAGTGANARRALPEAYTEETRARHKPSGHTLPAAVSHSPHAEPGDALDLASRDKPSSLTLDPESEMHELYALGDFTGALRAAELLLGRDSEHAAALRMAQDSREQLERLYATRIGSLRHVPQVRIAATEIRWLGLDPRAGFLLSRIDGVSDVEELLDICGMDRLEALRTLVELLERGAVHVG